MAEVIMTFNGEIKPYIQVLHGLKRSSWAPVSREMLRVPGVAGAYLIGSVTEVREISVPIRIAGTDYEDLQLLKEELAEWLVHDEPRELTFSDEPERTYYAVVEAGFDSEDIIKNGKGTINFVCPDPYKYGEEITEAVPMDGIVDIGGTAETPPTFNAEVLQNITFAMIQKGVDDYMLIGEPVPVDTTPVTTRTLLFSEDGTTINTWSPPTPEMGSSQGSISYDGSGITAPSYGTGGGYHGPIVYKEVPVTGDFEIEVRGHLRSNVAATGRLGFQAFDDQLRPIGMMNAVDIITSMHRKSAEGRVGRFMGDFVNYPISSRNYRYEWEDFPVYLRLRRIGDTFEFYVARVQTNGKHVNTLTQLWTTVEDIHRGPLKYVTIFFDKYGSTPSPHTNRIDSIKAWSINESTVDNTPYIAYTGDIITFDHESRSILINGFDRTDLKAFGARYFDLNKGTNVISVYPQGALNVNLTYKERYK